MKESIIFVKSQKVKVGGKWRIERLEDVVLISDGEPVFSHSFSLQLHSFC